MWWPTSAVHRHVQGVLGYAAEWLRPDPVCKSAKFGYISPRQMVEGDVTWDSNDCHVPDESRVQGVHEGELAGHSIVGWFFWWVTFKSRKIWMSHFWMSHFQVSRDLDESLSSLARLGWVTFKSLKTWMRSGKKRNRVTGSLSSIVDCCYPNLLDLLRVKTRVCSYNLLQHLFWVFLHILLWWNSLNSKEPKVCLQERKSERKREKTERK
jgi:hypothetical protein